jgi:hypothetical protein
VTVLASSRPVYKRHNGTQDFGSTLPTIQPATQVSKLRDSHARENQRRGTRPSLRLNFTPTIKAHVAAILKKLDVPNRVAAAAKAKSWLPATNI